MPFELFVALRLLRDGRTQKVACVSCDQPRFIDAEEIFLIVPMVNITYRVRGM